MSHGVSYKDLTYFSGDPDRKARPSAGRHRSQGRWPQPLWQAAQLPLTGMGDSGGHRAEGNEGNGGQRRSAALSSSHLHCSHQLFFGHLHSFRPSGDTADAVP